MYWWHNHVCPESLLQKPSNRYRQPFKVTVACFQKNSLNQISYHQHFQYSSIWYIEVITQLIYGSPLLVQIQFCQIQKILDGKKLTINMNHLWQTNFLLLSRWSNLVCVHARKQTAILYVVIVRRKGWCVTICANVWTVQILIW